MGRPSSEASSKTTVVHSQIGMTYSIEVAENGSTGYKWAVAHLDAAYLVLTNDDFMRQQTSEPFVVGVGGTRRFHVTMLQPGVGQIELKHWRSWLGDSSVVERRVFTFHITDGPRVSAEQQPNQGDNHGSEQPS